MKNKFIIKLGYLFFALKKSLKRIYTVFTQYQETFFFWFFLLALLITALLAGYGNSVIGDFFPINGDFQNYNGYRRLLAGQIPYKDFVYYIGFGALYLNTFFLLFVEGTFLQSLFVTHAVAAGAFGISLLVIASAAGLPRHYAAALSTFVTMAAVLFDKSIYIFDFFYESMPFLDYAVPALSDRVVRSVIPFLLVLIVLCVYHYRNLFPRFYRLCLHIVNQPILTAVLYGVAASIAIAWSNDYGIASFLALLIIYTFHHISRKRSFFLGYIVYILAVILGTGIIVSLLTLGHAQEWFTYNFLSVAPNQFWFFDVSPDRKLFYIQDFPFYGTSIISAAMILYFFWKKYQKKETLRDHLLLFLLLTTNAAMYGYTFGAGIGGLKEPINMVVYIIGFTAILQAVRKKITTPSLEIVIFLMCSVFVAGMLMNRFQKIEEKHQNVQGEYIKALGGHFIGFGKDLKKFQEFENPEAVFSTYASAFEALHGTFQPSGYDYIIHAIGENSRNEYMQAFRDADPEYVTTIRADFTVWEMWVSRANWFFYRELLKEYEPVTHSLYNVFWKKREIPFTMKGENICTIRPVDTDTTELVVTSSNKNTEHYTDIQVSYSTSWHERSKSLLHFPFRRLAFVNDRQITYFLPPGSPTEEIVVDMPVLVIEGVGVTTLESYPQKTTSMTVSGCDVTQLLPALPTSFSDPQK